MLKTILSKLGFGSAKIDLQLDDDTYVVGSTVKGVFKVYGSSVEQDINDIEAQLIVRSDDVEKLICSVHVDGFFLARGETKFIPITFELPAESPITTPSTHYVIETNLDIDEGRDSSDTDDVIIVPSGALKNLISAVESLGFELVDGDYDIAEQLLTFKTISDRWSLLKQLSVSYQIEGSATKLEGLLTTSVDDNILRRRYTISSADSESPSYMATLVSEFLNGILRKSKENEV